MAKIKRTPGNDFCPQTLYLYGNYEEDGTPHFGLFCWFGWCGLEGDELGVMACIGEEKKTKDLIRRTGMLSANLVSEGLLPLADYYGCVCGRENRDKMNRLPTVERGQVLDVPTIAESPVSFELQVVEEKPLCAPLPDGTPGPSTLFLCRVVNATIDERLTDKSVPFMDRLRLAAPVLAPGEEHYLNPATGQDLGVWGGLMGGLS